MQTEKHLDKAAVLIYFGFLLCCVVGSLIDSASFNDIIYLVVVICCVLKYLMIIKRSKK